MKLKEKFKGVIVPMVSPVTDNFNVDEPAVERIIASFVKNDVIPFVLGTTGEAASLSASQKVELVKASHKSLEGKLPLMAGIGGNSLFTSIEEGKQFADLGAEALVATIPNYYPSDETQMLHYFEKLADNVALPLFIYNIPVTTHHSIPLQVAEKLSYHPNIAGVKDSERDEDRLNESLRLWKNREDFMFLVGWAARSAYGVMNGANGIVPSVGNLVPQLFQKLYVEAAKGNAVEANEMQELTDNIAALCQAGRNISQSIPAMKVLMQMEGICGAQVLPPMIKMDAAAETSYKNEMQGAISNLMTHEKR